MLGKDVKSRQHVNKKQNKKKHITIKIILSELLFINIPCYIDYHSFCSTSFAKSLLSVSLIAYIYFMKVANYSLR